MHRALFISEVIHTIASQYLRAKDLAILARTCRTFSEPALDALWSSLADLTPLLRCLPNDLVTRGEISLVSSGVYSLRRPFTTADWLIFCRYSARVKVLCSIVPEDGNDDSSQNSDWVDVISDEVFHALSFPPTSEPLFPKLRVLVWHDVQPEGFSFLELLLGPSIISLDIHPHSSSTRVLRLASKVADLCPRVKRFAWLFPESQDSSPTRIVTTMSRLIMSWRNLQYVACHHLNAEAIKHLSSLSSLNVLATTALDATYPAFNEPAFPGISQLHVTSPSPHKLHDVNPLIRAGRSSPVAFTATAEKATPMAVHNLLVALSDHLDRERLESINLIESDSIHTFTLDQTALAHLFPFRNLLYVNLDTRRHVDLDDAALLVMADAWPRLVALQINENWGWRRLSRVTLHGVRALLQRLPSLEELSLAVDCETVAYDAFADGHYGTFKVERPFALNVLDSKIGEEYVEVAAFLSDLFPEMMNNIDLYSWGWRFDEGPMVGFNVVERWQYSERWFNVANTVVMMNKIRKREKDQAIAAAS